MDETFLNLINYVVSSFSFQHFLCFSSELDGPYNYFFLSFWSKLLKFCSLICTNTVKDASNVLKIKQLCKVRNKFISQRKINIHFQKEFLQYFALIPSLNKLFVLCSFNWLVCIFDFVYLSLMFNTLQNELYGEFALGHCGSYISFSFFIFVLLHFFLIKIYLFISKACDFYVVPFFFCNESILT